MNKLLTGAVVSERNRRGDHGTVWDIMSREVISVDAAMPAERLLLLLIDENISGVPVVDEAGNPLGMVSKTDLLSELGDGAGEFDPRPEPAGPSRPGPELAAARRTAADLMTHPLVGIAVSASILEAAALMTSRRVHRLGVVDPGGRLVGIVTLTDVVRWVARG